MHILPPFAGQPCGTPPLHPPYHLHTCFLCPMSPKKMFSHENLTAFAIFQIGGWDVNFAHFGHFWPFLNQRSGPGRAPSGPLMISPCYIYLIPCPNICWARLDDFWQILNTSPLYPGTGRRQEKPSKKKKL